MVVGKTSSVVQCGTFVVPCLQVRLMITLHGTGYWIGWYQFRSFFSTPPTAVLHWFSFEEEKTSEMASFSASPSISCFTAIKPNKNPTSLLPTSISASTFSCSLSNRLRVARVCFSIPNSYPNSSVSKTNLSNLKKIRSVAEDTVIPEQQEDTISNQGEVEATVSVPVSPSDILTMFFQVLSYFRAFVPKLYNKKHQILQCVRYATCLLTESWMPSNCLILVQSGKYGKHV